MRILTLTTSYPRSLDDYAGRFVSDLNGALRRKGAITTTLCPQVDAVEPHVATAGDRTIRVGYGNSVDRKLFYDSSFERRPLSFLETARAGAHFLRAMRRVVLREIVDHDAVVVHWPWPLLLACRGTGRQPTVGLCHGADLRWLQRSGPARFLFRRCARRLKGLLTTRCESVPLLKSLFAGPVLAGPMGADSLRYQGLPVSGPLSDQLLYVGRLVPQKGVDLLIRVLPAIGRPLTVMGGGPEEQRLRQLAASLQVPVTFRGWQSPDAVAEALASARLVVVPSRDDGNGGGEGFPTILCEAALAGTPMLAARVGGIGDWIPADATYEADSEQDLIAALRRLLSTPRVATIQDSSPFASDAVATRVLDLLSLS